ncbi:MAG: MAPEG family protein [Proteobacteria bacterium]|nr:MAPEG family protein [Pseudomonadota bacterium]
MSIPVAALLAFAMWTIALLAFTIGVLRWWLILSGKAALNSFPGDEAHGSPFYRRATRAHANCVENLPVFGAIVVAAQATAAHSPTLDVLAVSVVVARVFQTSTHLISGSNTAVGVRFSFLMVQLVAFAWMGALIGLHARAA